MKSSNSRRLQSGYSLAELLVVLGIIGIVSLVTVPQFIAYQRSGQLKSSMRQMTNDLRLARQKAVSERTSARLRFTNNSRTYTVEKLVGSTWTPLVSRTLEESCTITIDSPNYLPTATIDSVTNYLVSFSQTGTVRVDGGQNKGTFRVRTEWALSRTYYTIEVYTPGFVKAV